MNLLARDISQRRKAAKAAKKNKGLRERVVKPPAPSHYRSPTRITHTTAHPHNNTSAISLATPSSPLSFLSAFSPSLRLCESLLILIISLITLSLLSCATPPDLESAYPLDPPSLSLSDISVGWNLGNTLDAWTNGVSSETVWGNPRANESIFAAVKAHGFDIVRIPVTWMGHIGPPPSYRIEPAFIKRVDEVVQMAHNADLAVILNLHHDGSVQNSGKDNGWLSINTARKTPDGHAKVTAQYTRVWQQIATYFKNHGDWLIFESLNEVHDGGWGWSPETPSQYPIVNEWNQAFTTAVRATGANNALRYLLYNGYCATPRHALSGAFALPVDTAVNRQIVSFHYYDPHEFGIVGDAKGGRSDWGTDQDKQKVATDFAQFKTKFIDNGIPVIIGESGAVRQQYPSDKPKEETARASRLAYITWIYAQAKQNNLIAIYWDNGLYSGPGEKFGLFDRRTGAPNSPESEAIIKAITAPSTAP